MSIPMISVKLCCYFFCFIDDDLIKSKPIKPMRILLSAPPGPLAFGVMADVELHLLDGT